MSEFELYLKLGFEHITDLQGYDHMLFLLALSAVYTLKQWRPLLWLATAFTLGHSITLAMAAMGIFTPWPLLIEILIPVTILLTALGNFLQKEGNKRQFSLRYGMAFVFGLVHGLGFSNYLKMLLMGEESVTGPLLSFNIGIELGQLLVLALIVGTGWLIHKGLNLPHKYLNWAFSAIAAVLSMVMIVERLAAG